MNVGGGCKIIMGAREKETVASWGDIRHLKRGNECEYNDGNGNKDGEGQRKSGGRARSVKL